MIWTLTGIGLIILAVIFNNIYDHTYDECWLFISASALIVGFITTFVCVAFIIVNILTLDLHYTDTLSEKQMLEYRIEHCEDTVGNELLYTDILNFNQELRHSKKFANSPWTNWMSNQKVAEIEYIDILEDNRGGDTE